jgi:uncharacterized protein YceK
VRRRLLLTIALPLTVAGFGCATALNVQDDSRCKPYGGVTMSLFEFSGDGERAEEAAIFLWPFWVMDKPLSFFADTLTLPYTLWTRWNTQSSTNHQTPHLTPDLP